MKFLKKIRDALYSVLEDISLEELQDIKCLLFLFSTALVALAILPVLYFALKIIYWMIKGASAAIAAALFLGEYLVALL